MFLTFRQLLCTHCTMCHHTLAQCLALITVYPTHSRSALHSLHCVPHTNSLPSTHCIPHTHTQCLPLTTIALLQRALHTHSMPSFTRSSVARIHFAMICRCSLLCAVRLVRSVYLTNQDITHAHIHVDAHAVHVHMLYMSALYNSFTIYLRAVFLHVARFARHRAML